MKSPTPTRERIIAKPRFHLIFVAAVVVMRSARRRLANKRRKFDIVYVTTAKLFCGFRPSRAPNKPGDFGPADPQRRKKTEARRCARYCIHVMAHRSLAQPPRKALPSQPLRKALPSAQRAARAKEFGLATSSALLPPPEAPATWRGGPGAMAAETTRRRTRLSGSWRTPIPQATRFGTAISATKR